MNELIPTTEMFIEGRTVPTCNARDLHQRLLNRRQFADWIKDRITKYNFLENQDYVSFSQSCEKPRGGRPSTEYHLTLDMAKELAMVENNSKGKEIRRYFIRMENTARELLKSKTEALKSKTEALESKTEALESKTKALETDNQVLARIAGKAHTEIARTRTEVIHLTQELIEAHRRTKHTDTQALRRFYQNMVAHGVLEEQQIVSTRWKYTVTDFGAELGFTTNKNGTIVLPD